MCLALLLLTSCVRVSDGREEGDWNQAKILSQGVPGKSSREAFSHPLSFFLFFFLNFKNILFKMKSPCKVVQCLLCKDEVSQRIKEGREEIKKAMWEGCVWQPGPSPSDPVLDHMGPPS